MAEDLLLRFTPHVPRRHYATGWTADRQIAFIAALARTGVVSHAARSVGMSPRSAYTLRATVRRHYSNWVDIPMTAKRAASLGPGYVYSFAAAWDHALACGVQLQADAAVPLAIEGERVPIIWRGTIIGWRKRFNDRLMLAALDAYRRTNEGQPLDHDRRIAWRTVVASERIEGLLRLGPVRWPEPAPAESHAVRLAAKRDGRGEERAYGKRMHGMLDARGPADSPPRPLAEREAPPVSQARVMKLLDRATKFHETREKCEAKRDWRAGDARLKRGDAARHRTEPAAPPS